MNIYATSMPHLLGFYFLAYVCRSFSNISVASDYTGFSSDHNISSTFQSVQKRFTAAVQVVEFALYKSKKYSNIVNCIFQCISRICSKTNSALPLIHIK